MDFTWVCWNTGRAVLSLPRRNYLHVVYREVSQEDDFIIIAFVSRRVNRRMIIWPRRS
jgi:hypothetical protein